MESLIIHISDVKMHITSFLRECARELPNNSAPLILYVSYDRTLNVKDSSGQRWKVDETYINSFYHIYSNQAYKIVRLVGWTLDLKFNGKTCNKIEVVSSDAQFYSKKESKRISACHFKFTLAETPIEIDQLGKDVKGYLNRIGKREVCSISLNIHKEMKSLISFAHRKQKPLPPPIEYHPWKKVEKDISPLEALSPAGLEVFEKMRHFIKIEQIIEFAKNTDLSMECTSSLKELLQEKLKIVKKEQGDQIAK